MFYNRCTGIYKFGNNIYPWRIRRRSNLGHIFGGKKCILWAGKYGKYLLDVTLNYTFLFLRLMRLHCKVLKILIPAQNLFFWKHESLAFGLWKWCLFLVLILCTDEFLWKGLSLFTIKYCNDNIYWHITVKSQFL